MSFKATIDIFVNFSYLQIRFLNRQGYIRYRMKIYMKCDNKQAGCHPYNIIKGQSKLQDLSNKEIKMKYPSEIDGDNLFYYSRLIPIMYRPSSYQQNETVFFKAYVNTEIIQQVQFFCTIDCLFIQNVEQEGNKSEWKQMEVVGRFQAKIHKINDISTFLPIIFDVFEGFMIVSTFHSTILEFKFSQDDFQTLKSKKQENMVKKYNDFYSYVDFITNKFNRKDLQKYYQYYRQFLERQHEAIQNRHEQLLNKLLKEPHNKFQQSYLENYQINYVKIKKNIELLKVIIGKNNSNVPIKPDEKALIVQMITKDFSSMKAHLYRRWSDFFQLVMKCSRSISKCYRKQYQALCKDRFKNNVFSHKIKNHDWRMSKYLDRGKLNVEQALAMKKKTDMDDELWKQHFPIQNISYFGKSQTNVKMFQEVYLTNFEFPVSSKVLSKHIIFLVHGFQATRQDFLLFKSCLQVVYGLQVIISTCNEGQTQNSIMLAGKRLANEITKILQNQNNEYRVSFVGHSMGGLIIRSAIPELIKYKDKFYTFMTFSSPHLGYLYQTSPLIKAGLWFLSSWHKIEAVQQLSMKDQQSLTKTTLYQLSKNGALDSFKRLCFVCSSQDQYVPYESARVQQNQQFMKETIEESLQTVIRDMVDGILGNISAVQISRINVVFNIESKNFDSFIGRTGHVKFLSDIQFIRQFCSCFDKFFI